VGVVRRPTGWFHATVDENYPEPGPPEALLAELKARQADFKRSGMCDEGAHDAAWEEVRFVTGTGSELIDRVEARLSG